MNLHFEYLLNKQKRSFDIIRTSYSLIKKFSILYIFLLYRVHKMDCKEVLQDGAMEFFSLLIDNSLPFMLVKLIPDD